jgi:hypothetical protein
VHRTCKSNPSSQQLLMLKTLKLSTTLAFCYILSDANQVFADVKCDVAEDTGPKHSQGGQAWPAVKLSTTLASVTSSQMQIRSPQMLSVMLRKTLGPNTPKEARLGQ